MTTYTPSSEECNDLDARDVRALTEVMSVLDEQDPRICGADDLYLVVSGSGREYLVDIREGACECPDFQYNLPTKDGRRLCKHAARITYETGMRPIPSWVDPNALDDQIGMHVDAEPVFARDLEEDHEEIESDDSASRAIADGGRERPVDCCCQGDLPCYMCWREGFREPAEEGDDQ
ncbi:SWIM zinc finger family protein [Halobacteria archaeon AArc-m2/3/4]|uniref:SWIM zinc finger family protein n=1 Tax=Natronoglomus mannanivorans TaxID=2979990 RepID=A0ABT2QIX3_9EURY|nr:SWIM zinc finger family protein [Halobacteria archaeon AArc-m2/3/4]